MINALKLTTETEILDFGAAIGGLLYALKSNGINNVIGTDISYWAIDFGRKQYGLSKKELQYYNIQLLEHRFDCIFFLDVLEHIYTDEIHKILTIAKADTIAVRIPVSLVEGDDFVLDVSKNDKTHIQIHTKEWWIDMFDKHGYSEFEIFNKDNIYDSEGVLAGYLKRSRRHSE